MKTEKGNKLIAKFMEVDEAFIKTNMLEYHYSWDWLMPVVGKSCEMHDQETYYYIGDHYDALERNLYNADIRAAWANLTDIIQWYNENKKL